MHPALPLTAVYLGSCCLILWLVRRTLRPISWRACLGLIALPLALTGPAVLTGSFWGALNLSYATAPLHARVDELPLPEEEYRNGILLDHICEVVPWRKAVREAVKTGHAPLRNRFVRAGDILLASSQPAPFHPKVWLGFLLPLATAFTFACSFTFFLAALFGYLYLVELRIEELAAFFGAAVWMLSGFITFWCGWSMASVFVTLPLILLGTRRLARGLAGGFAAKTVGWTLALLAGHPESVLHLAAVAGVLFLWELYYADGPRRRPVMRALGAGLLSAALSAPALLPFLEALPQTHDFALRRSGAVHESHSVPWAEAGASALGALYPHAYGEHWSMREELPERFDAATGAFVGGLALTFALIGVFSRWRERWPFAVLAVGTYAVAVGLPWISDLLGALPLFDIAINHRLSGVTAFSLAVLAAFGFQHASSAYSRAQGVAMAVVGLTLTLFGLHRASWMTFADTDSAALERGLVLLAAPIFLAALAGLFLFRRPRVLAVVWLGLFFAFHLPELPRLYHRFSSDLFYPPVEELAELPSGREPYRVTGHGHAMIPGQSALFELEDVRGHQAMRHRRLAATYRLWCAPQGFWFCRVDDLSDPFLSLMNVRFAVADPQVQVPWGWRLLTRGPNAAIFRNPKVLTRAFVPAEVRRVSSDTKLGVVIRAMEDVKDFSKVAWIEVDEEPFGPAPNGVAKVSTRADGPDLLIEASVEEPAWVVVSETFWKGWRAFDDTGRELSLHHADAAFLGFHLPAGEHRIRLVYRPRSFEIGVTIAGLAILAIVGFAVRRRLQKVAD